MRDIPDPGHIVPFFVRRLFGTRRCLHENAARRQPAEEIGDGTEAEISAKFRIGDADGRVGASEGADRACRSVISTGTALERDDFSSNRHPALVVRFRSSHHHAAPSFANFGIQGPLATL
jgi:hypothetical protein